FRSERLHVIGLRTTSLRRATSSYRKHQEDTHKSQVVIKPRHAPFFMVIQGGPVAAMPALLAG
ncbi:MAG: hypothetical protein M3126_08300, partial [Candidatus Eremiobacteraeota bacterium]|nr:hypothetical protein [Candidatus Eremiobacteraeota bacterium]